MAKGILSLTAHFLFVSLLPPTRASSMPLSTTGRANPSPSLPHQAIIDSISDDRLVPITEHLAPYPLWPEPGSTLPANQGQGGPSPPPSRLLRRSAGGGKKVPTVRVMTTTSPLLRTRSTPRPPLFIVNNGNRVCIVAQMRAFLEVSYWSAAGNWSLWRIPLNENTTYIPGRCTNMTRTLIMIPQPGWSLNLTWIREPEMYETGEEGFSSVGAPRGTLSGTYTLTYVNLSYQLPAANWKGPRYLSSYSNDRFKARSGDYYFCESERVVFLSGGGPPGGTGHPILTTTPTPNITTTVGPINAADRVVLRLTHLRLQVYSDVNIAEFTGSAVRCPEDHPVDNGLSMGIGIAISVLIVIVLVGLTISRLHERDQQYKAVENQAGYSSHHWPQPSQRA